MGEETGNQRGFEQNLDSTVVAVVGEAEGAESSVGAVEAVHVALSLMGIRVEIAQDEEARRQQRPQPPRPPVVVLRPSAALFQIRAYQN